MVGLRAKRGSKRTYIGVCSLRLAIGERQSGNSIGRDKIHYGKRKRIYSKVNQGNRGLSDIIGKTNLFSVLYFRI